MANIKDIAKLAGVSVTTVSRVLNGHPYVSGAKREAVLQAMEQAGIPAFCQENGIHVPGQLAIVGFDNQPIARMMRITTFEIPLVEIGRRAFLQAVDGGKNHEEIHLSLIERFTV